MKRITLLFSAMLSVSVLFAQKTETRNLSSFTEVSAGESVEVLLVKGSSESAQVEVTGADLSDVETEVSRGRLKVGMANGSYKNVKVKVTVTYKSLESVSVSSSAAIFSDGTITANSLILSVSSSGYIEASLDTKDLTIKVSSSGAAELDGTTSELDVSVSSSGDLNAYGLKAENAVASANSSGTAKIYVSTSLEASANSSGKVIYKGSPKVSATANSAGKVVKG